MVTGSCVNAVLAITALIVGIGSGIAVALISPVCAFLLGIAPQVLSIMAGNVCFVVLLRIISSNVLWRRIVALLAAAVAKFGLLYFLVVAVICGFAVNTSLGKKLGEFVVLALPMLKNYRQCSPDLSFSPLSLAALWQWPSCPFCAKP